MSISTGLVDFLWPTAGLSPILGNELLYSKAEYIIYDATYLFLDMMS